MKRFILPVMLMLGAAAPAFAQPEGGGAQLDPALRAKVQAMMSGVRDQAKPIWQDARTTREALKAEMQKAQPDDATLVQLEDRLASDRQQLQALRADKQAELKKQLSPKEYAQLMLARHHFGRRFHGGGRMQGGGGGAEQ